MAFKRRSLVFVGDATECAWRLPFAQKELTRLEKNTKTAIASAGFQFHDGAQVKCTVTPKFNRIQITAGGGNYIFAGLNQEEVTGSFVALRNRKTEDPDYEPTDKGKEILPTNNFVATFPYSDTFVMDVEVPRFTWADTNYIVSSGVGQRYHIIGLDYVGRKHFDTRIDDLAPTVLYPNGIAIAEGIEGSEVVAASVFSGYVLGVSLRGVLKYWSIADPDIVTEMNLTLPSWIGDPVTIDLGGSVGEIQVEQGWGTGDSGIQWNFNRAGTAVCGLISYYRNFEEDPEKDPSYFTESVAYLIRLNPEIDEEGEISFSPESFDLGQSISLHALDWNYLPSNKSEEMVIVETQSKKYKDYGSTISEPIDGYEGDVYRIQRGVCRSLTDGRTIYEKNLAIVRYNVYYEDSPDINPEDPVPGSAKTFVFDNSMMTTDLRHFSYNENAVSVKNSDNSSQVPPPAVSFLAMHCRPVYEDEEEEISHNSIQSFDGEEETYFLYLYAMMGGDDYPPNLQELFSGTNNVRKDDYSKESGINCFIEEVGQDPETDEWLYSYKFACELVYNLKDKPLHRLDVIDIDGEITEHATIYEELGFSEPPRDDGSYGFISNYCLYNLFTGYGYPFHPE